MGDPRRPVSVSELPESEGRLLAFPAQYNTAGPTSLSHPMCDSVLVHDSPTHDGEAFMAANVLICKSKGCPLCVYLPRTPRTIAELQMFLVQQQGEWLHT